MNTTKYIVVPEGFVRGQPTTVIAASGWQIAAYIYALQSDTPEQRRGCRRRLRAKLDAAGIGNNHFMSRSEAEAALRQITG